LLRAAGLDAGAAQSADAAVDGPLSGEGGALLAFTHTGAKPYTAQAVQHARAQGALVIQVSGVGVEGADLVTVPQERSSAYTASHLGHCCAQRSWRGRWARIWPEWARSPRPSTMPTAHGGTIVGHRRRG
jgi:hypothetical protein